MKKGKYIILEGCEGCGKTTQIKKLYHSLTSKSLECVLTKEPGGTMLGLKIRQILLNNEGIKIPALSELFLYEADRVSQYNDIILPNLEEGKIIISDRSWPSTYAYQGAAGKINKKLIDYMNSIAIQGVKPDLLFILDIEAEKGLNKETNPDRFAKKGLEYHEKVRQGYLEIAKKYSDFSIVIPYLEDKEDKMQQKIREHIKERLNI